MTDPNEASQASFHNRAAIEAAAEASCYFCLRTFDSSAVERYTDNGETATCPHCDVDALVPGRLSPYELRGLHEFWFCKGGGVL
jgi:hypothetical protein